MDRIRIPGAQPLEAVRMHQSCVAEYSGPEAGLGPVGVVEEILVRTRIETEQAVLAPTESNEQARCVQAKIRTHTGSGNTADAVLYPIDDLGDRRSGRIRLQRIEYSVAHFAWSSLLPRHGTMIDV